MASFDPSGRLLVRHGDTVLNPLVNASPVDTSAFSLEMTRQAGDILRTGPSFVVKLRQTHPTSNESLYEQSGL